MRTAEGRRRLVNSGTASATDVAISNVTIPGRTQVYVGSQTPVGTHDLTWNQSVNMVVFDATNGRYSRLALVNSTAGIITIGALTISSNPLVQTLAQLFDPLKTKVQNLTGTGMTTGLTGSLAFSDNAINYILATTGLSGTIPPLPATMTRLDVTASALQTPPATYGTCTNVTLTDNQLNGTHVIATQNSFILSNTGTGVAGFNYQGTTGTGNIVDLRGSTIDITNMYLNGCRITQLLFPTTIGRKVSVIMLQCNPNLALITWPTWVMVPPAGYLYMFSTPQNQILPLGSVIAASSINVVDCSMNEASVNGTIDSMLNASYVANFAPATTAKNLSIQGNNAPISNVGDATRVARLTAYMKANNWAVNANLADYPNNPGLTVRLMQRITSFKTPATNPANRIIIIASMFSTQAAGTNVYISDTTNFNGTWKFISRGTDVEGLNGNTNGNYLLVEKTTLYFGTPNFATEVGIVIV